MGHGRVGGYQKQDSTGGFMGQRMAWAMPHGEGSEGASPCTCVHALYKWGWLAGKSPTTLTLIRPAANLSSQAFHGQLWLAGQLFRPAPGAAGARGTDVQRANPAWGHP